MSVIRLQEMTPQIYTEESRDFQLLSRLYDSVFNGLKFDTDSILDLIDTKECRTSVLQLLQTKLGFFTERKIDDEKLRSILECFPILVRNKGSLRAIKETLYLFLRMYSVSSNMEIYYLPTPYSPPFSEEEPCVLASGKLPENNSLVIRIHSFETKPDTSVMEEIFKYILPAGINYYIEFDKGATLQDIVLKSEDSAELTFVSDNINSQLRSSDQTEPYNIGTVNTSSLISTDSYVSNRFIGYYGDEQSASDYLATLVDKIYSTAVINYSATGEVSGPIVSISDAEAGAPVEALSVEVEPIQDLHGYDAPWPAGGGKNKGRFASAVTDNSRTQNGCTSAPVVGEKAKVHISGTVVGGTYFLTNAQTFAEEISDNKFLPAGTYTVSTNLPRTIGGVNAGLYITGHYTDGTSYSGNIAGYTYDGHSVTFTLTDDVYYNIQMSCPVGYSFGDDGIDIWAQIESGSTATAFSPYSNICPIYGHTDADVTRTGKNMSNPDVFDITEPTYSTQTYWLGLSEDDGVFTLTRPIGWGGCGNVYIGTFPAGSYTVSFKLVDDAGVAWGSAFTAKKKGTWETEQITSIGNSSSPVGRYSLPDTITISEPCDFWLAVGPWVTNGAEVKFTDIQVEIGDTASETFSPYVGTTYPIPLGQTVYGATVDTVTGVMTNKTFAFNGEDIVAIVLSSQSENTAVFMIIMSNNSFPKGVSGKIISNRFSTSIGSGIPGRMVFLNGTTLYVVIDKSELSSIDSEGALEWFSSHPTQFVYELATPQTIQLTPQQVELLQGQNNLWSDAGDISITYKRDGTYKAMICTAYSSNTPTWYRINFLGNLTTEEVSTQGGIVSALQAKGITVNNGDLIKYNNLYLLRVNNDWQECNYARYILNTYHLTE